MKKFFILSVSIMLALSSNAQTPPNHQAFNKLLKKHVSNAGNVNYKGFIKDVKDLDSYLNLLSNNAPKATWSSNEKLAYWINAYNAFTIKLMINNPSVKSIKEIAGGKPWDLKFFKIGDKEMNLNDIEHGIVRKDFTEPRIHFALVCASKSCPKLLNESFEANKLEKQLAKQAKDFLADSFRNKVDANNPQLSKLFDWYGNDFTKTGKTKIAYINQYTSIKINDNATITYIPYDWGINK